MADRPTEWALPGILGEIARLTSVELAIALAREHGGRELSIPHKLRPGHRLIRLLGRQTALWLCEHHGGDSLRIPSARTYLRWYDARRMRVDQGLTVAAISRKLNITTRRVEQLLEGLPAASFRAPSAKPEAESCPACGRRRCARPSAHAADKRQLDLFS